MKLETPTVLFAGLVHTVYRKVNLEYFSCIDNCDSMSKLPPLRFWQCANGALTLGNLDDKLQSEIMRSAAEFYFILKHDIVITNCFLLYNELKFLKDENKTVISFWDIFQVEPNNDRTMTTFAPEYLRYCFDKIGNFSDCVNKIDRGEKLELPMELETSLNLMF